MREQRLKKVRLAEAALPELELELAKWFELIPPQEAQPTPEPKELETDKRAAQLAVLVLEQLDFPY